MEMTQYLNDILDTIDVEDEEFFENDHDETDLYNSVMHLIQDFVDQNMDILAEPDYDDELDSSVKNFIIDTLPNEILLHDAENHVIEIIDCAIKNFFHYCNNPRSYPISEIFPNVLDTDNILAKITHLKTVPQAPQRTPEWYELRSNRLSASNSYKIFGTQAEQNQLIYEKCEGWRKILANKSSTPVSDDIREIIITKPNIVNINSPLHWGQKYEPVSAMIYSHCYNVDVDDLGCITHPEHSFIGASPDGIVTTHSSPRFGRLIEIKNIVNREIDGIPKKEYWIQMQLQLEVCKLNECDFFETKFDEYESASDFYRDEDVNTDTTVHPTLKHDGIESIPKKGIILYFISNTGEPEYLYKPINIPNCRDISSKWCEDAIQNYLETHPTSQFINIIYWKLEIVSCVLVLRNADWFKYALPQMSAFWDTIVKEREGDYSHRAPKGNKKSIDAV